MPDSPVKDKNYNLINILHLSLENAWRMEQFVADAEREGDTELANWFRSIQENSRKAGEQGKQLLAQRLQTEKA
ncbi:hypothetical protein OHA21_15260 [Actinoplanes sp. NBC_00393]|uniref:hypothetical protein n=1 Tax=Actinoplanes sp. NBC_00393 TaxID=2975953 RepID=UPI002E24572A